MASRSKIVLITGGNTGIGFETVKALMAATEQSYHILLTSRSLDKAEQAAEQARSQVQSKSTLEPIQVDVCSDESIQKAFDIVSSKHTHIDCLINNAGANFDDQLANGSMNAREAFTKAWDVNVTGAHIMTSTFLPLLLKSSDPRLLFVTSGMSSLTISADISHPRFKVPPAGLPKAVLPGSYKASKTGLNMLMLDWMRILKNDGVKVWSIAPGFLATGLVRDAEHMKQMGAADASQGGNAIRNVVEGKRDADVGKAIREYDTPIMPW